MASNVVIETYIRRGLEANRGEDTGPCKGETYMKRGYTILDVNWGQYTELRPGEIYRGKERAGKIFRENKDFTFLKRVGPTRSQPGQLWAGEVKYLEK